MRLGSFFAVVRRELRAYFVSPLAWAILTFFLFVQGLSFAMIVGYLADPMAPAGATPFDFFFNSFFFWITLIFATPVLTMRLLAEERRSGTVETLMTAPVTEAQVVVAKFLAALGFWCFLWVPTLLYPLIVERYAEVDWGPIAAGYLGIVGIGAMFLAVGLFASSFTKNQIVAAVATFGLLMLLFLLPWFDGLVTRQAAKDVLGFANLLSHTEELGKGIVDSRRLVYWLSTTVLFLFLTTRALEAKKWR